MARITKAQNPYGVKAGQIWQDRDSGRPNQFRIRKIVLAGGEPYAEVYREATAKAASIRLDRFCKYILVL